MIKNSILTIVFGCFVVFISQGQSSSVENQQNYMVETGFDFSTNDNSIGRLNETVKQPTYSIFSSYYGKHGLNISTMYSLIQNADTSYTKVSHDLSLMGSYSLRFLKYFTFTPGFCYFKSSKTSSSILSSYNFATTGDLRFTWRFLSTNVSANYLFGKDGSNEFVLSPSINAIIGFNSIFSKRDYLGFQPTFSINFANQIYFNRSTTQQYDFLKKYDLPPNVTIGELLNTEPTNNPELRNIQQELINTPEYMERLRRLSPTSEIGNLVVQEKFMLTAASFTLPVYYVIGNFMFNISASAYKPINQPEFINNKMKFYYGAGLSYTFLW